MEDINIPENVTRVLDRLEEEGSQAFVVGGCVRDSLMGREPSDWDVCTSARSEETAEVFRGYRVIETGMKHGTVTVLSGGEPIEITTYRIDGTYSDGRHPDSVSFTDDITLDLSRRDFTVNAMAYSGRRGLVDPFGGRRDLADQIIRCVGDPALRFGEDALRIMRALRFSAVLGFRIEGDTQRAIRELANTVPKVAIERINGEFCKLILGRDADRIIREYRSVLETALGAEFSGTAGDGILPRLIDLPEDLPTRLTALDPGDLKRLRFDNHTVRLVRDMRSACRRISQEISPEMLHAGGRNNALRIRMRFLLRDFDQAAVRGALILLGLDKEQPGEIFRDILKKNECCSLKQMAVTGRDLDCPDGKTTGQTLRRLLDIVIRGEVPNDNEALLHAASLLRTE